MGPTRAGIDVGGTFTDLALWDGTNLRTAKVPTTPSDQSAGVVAALEAGDSAASELVHGTTVATNALLERSGASTVLVTDAGFEDVLEIGRQDRPSLYDVAVTRPVPLVEDSHRIGVPGRTVRPGDAVAPEDLASIAATVARLDPDAVAISTLFSFIDPSREQALARAISDAVPSAALCASSAVAPEFREFERMSTTVINAYLTPVVARYLSRLEDAVRSAGVVTSPTVMRSSGGLTDLAFAAALPASIVLSGPAGGVVAAAALGSALGHSLLISFDMGGTSTDVCRIVDGSPQVAFEQAIGGLPNRMPSVAVRTVGAGGGSVGWADAGGALRVGPRSAGALPGPAAYGRGGTEATVTDANLACGRLGSGSTFGGSVVVDATLATDALSKLGGDLGLEAEGVALGMIEVVESHMERAIRRVSIEEGADPRRAMLIAFGGAGALHATALARRLQMAGVLVPPNAGVFSALGLLLAPPRADVVQGTLLRSGVDLSPLVGEVLDRARRALEAAGAAAEVVESSLDVRYLGQAHETAVPFSRGATWSQIESRFHEIHARRNGFSRPGDEIEVVAVRGTATGRAPLTIDQLRAPDPVGEARRGERNVLTSAGSVDAAVWWRPGLAPGDRVTGPAVIEEPEATTFLGAGEQALVHDSGAMEVSW